MIVSSMLPFKHSSSICDNLLFEVTMCLNLKQTIGSEPVAFISPFVYPIVKWLSRYLFALVIMGQVPWGVGML